MAYYNNKNNRISTICLISLLLFAAASTPPTHGQVITLRGLSVSGSLCCTPTGNCPGRGIPGVPVSLNCIIVGVGARGRNTTNVNGTFNITVPAITGLILGLPTLPCVAIVQLPLNSTVCPALSTINGVLAGSYPNYPNNVLIFPPVFVPILRWLVIPSR